MTKRILVTGATGFIGRHSLGELVSRGYEVVALTSRPIEDAVVGVEFVQCDLSNDAEMKEVVTKIGASHLLHMAWRAVIGGLWTAPENMNWLHTSLKLSQAFVEAGGKRITMSGSCAEYDWASGLCKEGVTPLYASTFYGDCKLGLFHALKGYCATNDVTFSWGRIFFVYGPGEHSSRLGADVVLSLLRGDEARCSHGMQLRDYIHCEDAGRGLAALADSDLVGDYNLATGKAVRVKDVIEALAEAAGRPELVKLGARQAPAFEPPLIVADMEKTLKSGLDWSPQYDLASGAVDTVEWFKKNH
jgi:nucleoside-diphosphate-sugar epimerase